MHFCAAARVDREDSSMVGRPVFQQHSTDDTASAGRIRRIPQPAQASEARGEGKAGDDVQYSTDKTET